jgi:hypothetical protein
LTPSKAAFQQAALLEPLAGTAGTGIVSAELFFEQLIAVDEPLAAFDLRFRRKTTPPFAHGLEKKASSSKLCTCMAHLL